MATAQATTDTVTSDGIVRRGNWTEERHEVLKDLTEEELWEEIMRIQAEHPERLTIEPVEVAAELVGA